MKEDAARMGNNSNDNSELPRVHTKLHQPDDSSDSCSTTNPSLHECRAEFHSSDKTIDGETLTVLVKTEDTVEGIDTIEKQRHEQQQEQDQQCEPYNKKVDTVVTSLEPNERSTSEQSSESTLSESRPRDMVEDLDTSSAFISKDRLIERCLEALAICLKRFPQHYKSQYRLAHAYLNIPSIKVQCIVNYWS